MGRLRGCRPAPDKVADEEGIGREAQWKGGREGRVEGVEGREAKGREGMGWEGKVVEEVDKKKRREGKRREGKRREGKGCREEWKV